MPHFNIYNSLSKRSENPVNELIGSFTTRIRQTLDLLEYSDNEPIVTFQISGVFRSTEKLPKPVPQGEGINPNITQWGSKYRNPSKHEKIYDGCGWHTVQAPLSAIPELIKDGFCLRYGVKEGGNDKSNFIGTQFLGFDLDEGQLLSPGETLARCHDYLIDPFIIHYSPSGTPDNPKLRLIVKLEEFCTDYDRLFNLAARITANLPNAARLHDPTRFYYGTIRPDEMYVQLGASNRIEYLEERLPELTDEQKNELFGEQPDDESTANKRFLKFFRERVLDAEFEGDPTRIVDSWIAYLNTNHQADLHNGDWFDRGSQNGSLNSWNGTDPIRGSATGQGDSFVISIQPDYTITFNVNHGSFGGDLVDLFYYLNAGSWDVAKQSPQQWRKTIDDICAVHGIESFNKQDKQGQEKKFYQLNGGEFEIFYLSTKTFKIAIDLVIVNNFDKIFYQPIDELVYRNGDFYLWEKTHWHKTSVGIIKRIISEEFRNVTTKDGDAFPLAHPSFTNSAVAALKNIAYREDWKNERMIINCKNGMLDLYELTLFEHDKRYWVTSKPLVNWNTNPDCTLADQMLESIKMEHREMFLRTLSIALDVDGFIRKFGRPRAMLLLGGGSNGKDVIKYAFSRILGALGNVTLDDFKENADTNKNFNLSKLALFSLNWSSENTPKVSLARLKKLISAISGGKHEAERKGKDSETVTVRSLFVFNLNELPLFSTLGKFILTRFCIIQFDKTYSMTPKDGEKKANPSFDSDPDLNPDDDYMNTVCEGLLFRFIEAWKRMHEEKGIDWSVSDESLNEHAMQSNQFARFIHIIGAKKHPKHRVLSPKLFAMYQAMQIMEERATGDCYDNKCEPIEELTPETVLKVEQVNNYWVTVKEDNKDEQPKEDKGAVTKGIKKYFPTWGIKSEAKTVTKGTRKQQISYIVGLEIEGVSEPID